ncbi:MAG: DUF3307 domain-containing protein [Mongoliibacter sp.]|uniref:DUF3307 domain-containing protein n=1 Tax=Mongoliibacter sp. TaxID=2022438 RepID=UPI0012EF3160|nr:DUF3307 domain-containing protein [Mongoliibacter sp.]TVP49412.1 MAG: DUF3307 domain-containing protein [Mongoliibacter sp.]
MIFLVKLLLAHLIGDFVLQPDSWVKAKETYKLKAYQFYIHVLLHGFLVLIVLWDLSYWLLALILAFSHAVIDIVKIFMQTDQNKPKWFIIDQGLHVFSILLIWYFWFQPEITFSVWMDNPSIWILLTSFLFVTWVVGILINALLANWAKALEESEGESLVNAGRYIGILERLMVFVFVLTDHWEAIGFLLAAKSIFRFGDLKESKDRKLTEYILIGTLLSFGIALLTGMMVKWLLGYQ